MRITKKHLCRLPFCYSTAFVEAAGETKLLFASEDNAACYSFDSRTFARETIWTEPGGTMSIVADSGGGFFAVQRFYPGFQAADAQIVHACSEEGGWRVRTLCNIPYVHRFDILTRGGVRYLLCCTLCARKEDMNDWGSPGGLYGAALPDDLSQPILLEEICGGMTRNHGYCRIGREDFIGALTSCDEGVFEVLPPEGRGQPWSVRKILDTPVSDIAVCDIDGDGVEELATIEPFHGASFQVYRNTPGGYQPIYRYPHELPFCHVAVGGKLRGTPCFIVGCRGGEQELSLLRWKAGDICVELLDKGAGPSNAVILPGAERDLILVANRELGEAAIYIAED